MHADPFLFCSIWLVSTVFCYSLCSLKKHPVLACVAQFMNSVGKNVKFHYNGFYKCLLYVSNNLRLVGRKVVLMGKRIPGWDYLETWIWLQLFLFLTSFSFPYFSLLFSLFLFIHSMTHLRYFVSLGKFQISLLQLSHVK